MRNLVVYVIIVAGFVSCEDVVREHTNVDELESSNESIPNLLFNEVSFKSSDLNEFGEKSDWIELINASDEDIVLEKGKWCVSDRSDKFKFELPEMRLASGELLVVWCDGYDQIAEDIHANFKLSAKGESVYLFYDGNLIDEVTFEENEEQAVAYARDSNDFYDWVYVDSGTLNSPNF
ncbi:MAG: lamin tail domain-containing protein [Crocinitomicaceae bacterium]